MGKKKKKSARKKTLGTTAAVEVGTHTMSADLALAHTIVSLGHQTLMNLKGNHDWERIERAVNILHRKLGERDW